MPTYRFSPEQAQREKRSLVAKMVTLLTLGCTVAIVTSYLKDPDPSLAAMLFPVAVLVLIGAVVGYVKIRPLAAAAGSLRITVEQDRISMEKTGSPGEIILRSEISCVVEVVGKGIRIDSVHKFQSIFVPKELSGFEQIRSQLLTWATVETRPDRTYVMYVVFVVVAGLVYFLLTSTSEVRIYGFTVATILGALLTVFAFVINRRKNLRK